MLAQMMTSVGRIGDAIQQRRREGASEGEIAAMREQYTEAVEELRSQVDMMQAQLAILRNFADQPPPV